MKEAIKVTMQKGNRKVVLTDKIHIKAFKKQGWVEVNQEKGENETKD